MDGRPLAEAAGWSYLQAGRRGVHPGVQHGQQHAAAVGLREAGEEGGGAGLLLGQQAVEGERFLGAEGSHGGDKAESRGACEPRRAEGSRGARDRRQLGGAPWLLLWEGRQLKGPRSADESPCGWRAAFPPQEVPSLEPEWAMFKASTVEAAARSCGQKSVSA